MRIACIIYDLGQGGAERVLSTMTRWWAASGHDVFVVTISGHGVSAYELDENIDIFPLDLARKTSSFAEASVVNGKRVVAIRKVVKRIAPDVVVGYMDTTNVVAIMACLGTGIPVVATEHTSPGWWPVGRVWNVLRGVMYPFAHTVVVQTQEAKASFSALIRRKVRVLPNPVELPLMEKEILPVFNGKVVVGMGRLAPEKGFDLLLRAFARVVDNCPGWILVVLGEGKERARLEHLRNKLGLDDRVKLPGFVSNPHDWLSAADLFVLSSKVEGFGNVLAEALMCGLPVVSTNCPSGPEEIVNNGVDGILVENQNEKQLAEAMKLLMLNDDLRKQMASRAAEGASRFGVESIMARWDDLLSGK